ncbi:hypothetical protein [Ruania albidiflava]|uniref:hypothetical protein n=1 Tax=Ruania albidiflava TaxID=366586 RepID=UPI0003B5132B|nr:hypothetical protein [Ruania albidiflava]
MSAAVLLTRPLVLAGGIDPEDASPGIGAFIAFLVLAVMIVLLAWSFTRHQRRIQANAAAREQQRQEAETEHGASDASGAGSTATGTEPGDPPPAGSPEVPDRSTTDEGGGRTR